MASKNSAISITLNLDASGFTSGVSRAGAATTTFNTQINAMVNQVDGAQGSLNTFEGSLAGIAAGAYLAEQAFAAFKVAITDLPASIIETNSNLQKMQTVLQGLSKETTQAGKEQEGKASISWLQDLAENAPFQITTLQNAFIKLKSVGIDPTTGALLGLVNAAAAAGATDQQLDHAALAIQEMAGRGVVSLEQLRRQLGRAIPTAMADMAYALGTSYGQMVTAVTKGTLEANTALGKLTDEWDRAFGGQAIAHMQNFYGQVNVFETEWVKLQKVVGDAGFMDAVSAGLRSITDLMRQPIAQAWAKDYGQSLAGVTTSIAQMLPTLIEMRGKILDIGAAFLAAFALEKLSGLTQGFVGMFMQMRTGLTGVATAFTETYYPAANRALAVTQFWNTGGLQAAQAMGVVAAGAKALGVAFLTVIPVAGQVIAIIYSLITAFGLLDDKVADATKAVNDGLITEKAVNTLKDRAAQVTEEMAKVNQGTAFGQINTDEYGRVMQDNTAAMKADLQKQMDDLTATISKGEAGLAQKQIDAIKTEQGKVTAERLTAIQSDYNVFKAKLEVLFNAPENSGKDQIATLNDWRVQSVKKMWDDTLAVDRDGVANALKMTQSEVATQRAAGQQLLDINVKKLESDKATAASQMATAEEVNKTVPKTKAGMTAIEREIEHMQETYAEASAKIAGSGTQIARVQAQIAGGVFKENSTPAQIAQLLQLAAAVDKETEAEKANAAAKTKDATAYSDIENRSRDASSKLAELNVQLMAGDKIKDPAGIRALDASLQDMRAKLLPTMHDMGAVDAMIKKIHDDSSSANIDSQIIALREKTMKLNELLGATKDDNYAQQGADEIAAAQKVLNDSTAIGDARMAQEKTVQDYIQAVRAETDRKSENALQVLGRQWTDGYKDLTDTAKTWANSAADTFETFVKTGKLDMGSLVTDILADYAKIQFKQAMGGLLSSLGSAVAGAFGGGGAEAGGGAFSNIGTTGSEGAAGFGGFGTHHTGGIVGANSGPSKYLNMAVFSGAPKFHTGGIVGMDSLDSSEMPIIAQKGEGVFTQGQMAAMGTAGNGQQVAVAVNVINQSGTAVSATQQGNGRFDGKQFVLDIVLTAVASPGPFRNSMKGALSS